MSTPFTERVCGLLAAIPPARVIGYGHLAALAGQAGAARQVVRILHSSSGSRHLPWHRVLRSDGSIGLPAAAGGALQRQLLEAEGVEFDRNGRVDLERFGWNGRPAP